MLRPVRARASRRAFVFGACLLGAWLTPLSPRSALAAKPAAASSADAEISFLGYQALPDGRGLLFVDLSRAVEVEVSRTGAVIEYKLVGASVPLRNNKNPLLLRDFPSSALTAVLVPSGKTKSKSKAKKQEPPSVRLVVTLRGKAQPTHRVVAHGKGARLEVELPPPSSS